MKEEVNLEQLVPYLRNAILGLNKDFLRELLIDASKSDKPHIDKDFCLKIGAKWNYEYNASHIIRNWFNGERNIRVKYLERILKLSKYNWQDIEANLIFIRAGTTRGEVYPNFPIKIDKRLGSIVGYILGDGSITQSNLQMFFTNKNKELLKEFENNMFEIFEAKSRIWYQKLGKFKEDKSKWIMRVDKIDEIPNNMQGALFFQKINTQILIAILGEFAYGKRKEMTREIMDCNRDFKIGLIRAFFDSECNVGDDSIRVYQNDKIILEKFRKLLREIGIISNSIRCYVKRDKERYYFSITGYYNFVKFLYYIGFTSKYKREALEKIVLRIKINKTFRLRHQETKQVILDILEEHRELNTKEIYKHLKRIYPDFKWDKSTIYGHLRYLISKGFITKAGNVYLMVSNV